VRHDIGYFDSRARLNPPLRQQRDRDALSAALAAAPSTRWCLTTRPSKTDAKTLPFAETTRATGLELLLRSRCNGASKVARIEARHRGHHIGAGSNVAAAGSARVAVGAWPTSASSTPATEWQVKPER